MFYRTEGFPVVVLRLFLVCGPGQDQNRIIPQIISGFLRNQSFPVSKGKQSRDFCYVSDTVDGILSTLDNQNCYGEIINLAFGKPITIKNMIEHILRLIGMGKPQFGIYPYRKGENMALYADTNKARELLLWEPRKKLLEAQSETIDYYRHLDVID